ncbi:MULTISPECIES: hypothetical protein [Protofrankia]|uniref:hypothetical protein n=1 Tax=Protofrankia TaxID=2994361 RepID=UPI0002E2EB6F|nr:MULTISPECIES: hypothetical protein [Protofrankia]
MTGPVTGSVAGSAAGSPVTPALADNASPTASASVSAAVEPLDLPALIEIERRLRGLATALIDDIEDATPHRGPAVTSGDTVGTLRATTRSLASLITVLWFDALRAGDQLRVPPTAFPLLEAVHRLLARHDPGPDSPSGPQSRPAPEASVEAGHLPLPPGLVGVIVAPRSGPVVTAWDALATRYATGHPAPAEIIGHAGAATSTGTGKHPDVAAPAAAGTPGRQICLLDHTELFDGTVWEPVTDPRVRRLGELLWIVTVRAHPGATIAAEAGVTDQARLFAAADWQVLTVGHGRTLSALFGRPGGQALRRRLDGMGCAEFQELLRSPGAELRRRLAGPGASGAGITRLLDELFDDEIAAALRDVGGNDLPLLVDAFDEVDPHRPTVLFVHVDEAAADRVGEPGRSDGSARPEEADGTDGTRGRTTGPDGTAAGTAGTGGAGRVDEWAGLPAGSTGARLARTVRRRLAPSGAEAGRADGACANPARPGPLLSRPGQHAGRLRQRHA